MSYIVIFIFYLLFKFVFLVYVILCFYYFCNYYPCLPQPISLLVRVGDKRFHYLASKRLDNCISPLIQLSPIFYFLLPGFSAIVALALILLLFSFGVLIFVVFVFFVSIIFFSFADFGSSVNSFSKYCSISFLGVA